MESIFCELPSPFFKSRERILDTPQVYLTQEDVFLVRRNESNHIRSVAPYILQVNDQNEKFYLKYVAAVGRMKYNQVNRELVKFLQRLPSTIQRQIGKHYQIPEKLICVAFDILDSHLVSFSGYFIVEPSSLYNPDGSKVTAVIQLTNKERICSQLGLIGIANRHLLAFEEYFLNQEEDLLAIFSLVYPFIPLVDGTGSGVLDLKTNDKNLEKVDDPILVELADDPEILSIYPTSSMNQIHYLKNRTQVIFKEFDMVNEKCQRLMNHVIRPYDKAYERYRHICTTELSCQNVSFCSTKFYAEVTGSGDESNETRFFKRVFPVGREGRHVIVLPYNNTDDREHLELLAPFATEMLYQRFEGNEPSPNDTWKKLNPCHVPLDQIHIPLFVPLYDTVTILRYWKTFQGHPSPISTILTIPERSVPEISMPKKDLETEKLECMAINPPQLRLIGAELYRKIKRLVSPEIQKSIYQFPANWDHPRSVNQLFCDNLLRNIVHSALRFCAGFVGFSNYLEGADKIYACGPKLFLSRYVPFFGISEMDTFSCFNVDGFKDTPKRKFCSQVNLRNVYRHLSKKHVNTGAKNRKLLRFRPFVLVPDMVTDKITGNQSIFDELSALHAHFEKQSLLGLTFFDVIKKARAKKKQFISKETQRIDHDAAVDTEEAHFIDSAKLNFDPCNPFTRESIDPSDIMTASAQSSKTPEINNDPIDVQISDANESLKLIEDFIPINEVNEELKSFTTDWVRAYVGITDCLAQIPNCEDRFIANVIILGHHERYFLVLPFKIDLLSGNMKCSRPFATENVFSRKNRHMPQINCEEVDLRPPVFDQISVEDLAYLLKLRDLVNWSPAHVRSQVIDRCGIPVGMLPSHNHDPV